MSVVIYFSMLGMILIAGFAVLGWTFRAWYLESKNKAKN